jgi:hypothetical protein
MADLKVSGFEKVAQVDDKGKMEIFGQWRGINFRWTVNLQDVQDALIQECGDRVQDWISTGHSRGKQKLKEVSEKAERIAWRVLADQVHATRIAIQYGTIEPLQAFAGFLITKDDKGNDIDLASLVAITAERGKLDSPDFLVRPRIEHSKK